MHSSDTLDALMQIETRDGLMQSVRDVKANSPVWLLLDTTLQSQCVRVRVFVFDCYTECHKIVYFDAHSGLGIADGTCLDLRPEWIDDAPYVVFRAEHQTGSHGTYSFRLDTDAIQFDEYKRSIAQMRRLHAPTHFAWTSASDRRDV